MTHIYDALDLRIKCAAACCSVLQYDAACCSVMQCVVACRGVMRGGADDVCRATTHVYRTHDEENNVCCSVLQRVAV